MNKISVIGFGKIGQAVAANILAHNIPVQAIDINRDLRDVFSAGGYKSTEPGLSELLSSAFNEKKLAINDDFLSARGSDAIIVSIPLLIDDQKKILEKPFLETMKKLAPVLENNTVIIIETSIPVGFSRNTILPLIESMGKKHGEDFLLAHSPERIKSGTMMLQLARVPKVIGGITGQALERARSIYKMFFAEELLYSTDSIEAAEMLKLAGMIYRDINIALSNQLAQFANTAGINFSDLIPLINTDGEANLLQPGIGVGGHCTPVYPYFLIENFKKAELDFTLAREGRNINNQMAAYAVSLVIGKLAKKKALVLGLSFRPNVKEDSLSTTYVLNEVLLRSGFDVLVHDSEFTADEIKQKGLKAAKDIYETGCDVVFLVTMHKEYEVIDLDRLAAGGIKYFVDGRNSIDKKKVSDAGMEYIGIGRL